MNTKQEDDYEEINIEPLKELDFFSPLLEWVRITHKYIELSEIVSRLIHRRYPTTVSFQYNNKTIKRMILEGLSEEEKVLMEETIKLKRSNLKRGRNQEEEEKFKKRNQIQTKINRIFNKLGAEIYGIEWESSLDTPTKKSVISSPSASGVAQPSSGQKTQEGYIDDKEDNTEALSDHLGQVR